jgi:tetratricopeptide (TPR) repeat protein
MNFLRKLFNRKPASVRDATASPPPAPVADADPANDADMIHVRDAYGREMLISKQHWREKVLPDNLEKNRGQPDQLADIIAQSLDDGFAADVLPYAARLAFIDSNPERGYIIYAATLLRLNRFVEAENVLFNFIKKHGETGAVLVNLAKTYAGRGDDPRVLQTLWRALTLDPNQGNGLGWYEAIHREKGGPAAGLEAFRRVAALPGAWRARLWIARHHLEQHDVPAALDFYAEALAAAPRPVPADLLMQMSGDLGKHACFSELIRLATPHYDISLHGLPTGNNLIKAYLDLGQIDAARALLDRLYAQNRPEWKQTLFFWDGEIIKACVATADISAPENIEVTMLSLSGPVWLPSNTPATELFFAKPAAAPVVAFLGATAEVPINGESPRLRLTDAPGRLSRALPLWLAEQTEFGTEAATRTLVPRLVRPSPGFVLSCAAWTDADAAAHARQVQAEEKPADYIVITHLNCLADTWTIELRLVRTLDAARLATVSAPCTARDPSRALADLTRGLLAALAAHAGIGASSPPPSFSPLISGNYLLRLEQLLAVLTTAQDQASRSLSGEHEILDGTLQLCLEKPESISIRLLLVQTLRSMKKIRPDILPEFRSRIDLLQKEKPLPEPAQSVVARILAGVFAV